MYRLVVIIGEFNEHTPVNGIIILFDLVVFPVSLLREEPGLLELVLEGLHALLVGQGAVLQHLAHTRTKTHNLELN